MNEPKRETMTIDRLFLELSQFTRAKTKRELDMESKLVSIARKIKQIVCTEGEDTGVVILSNDSPTQYDAERKCEVYLHDNFSPLGDALISLWRMTQENDDGDS